MSKGLLGIIAAIVICVGLMFSSYNGLVSMNENVTGKWAQVENQLQRRNDLVPKLLRATQTMKPRFSSRFLMRVQSLAAHRLLLKPAQPTMK